MDKSSADGRADTEIFAKYKCYCDRNTAEKTKSIADLTKEIAMLEGSIEELSASSGKLSEEVAMLTSNMADNEAARAEAKSLRDKANEDFVAEEADMKGAIDQMNTAIETLAAIGADETAKAGLATVNVHTGKFMGEKKQESEMPKKIAALSADAKKILKAASAFLPAKDRKALTGFIQAPFTGEYSAQSGEIVGILKNMRDTFKQNLGNARAAEKASLRAFEQYTGTATDSFNTMDEEEAHKQGLLGTNDESLGAARGSLETALENKDADEVFLADLTRNCADKTAQYEDLKMVRANEEAAIAKAISILNSDAAFETFGSVSATSSGATGFLQLERNAAPKKVRKAVSKMLEKVAKKHKSLRLAKIASQAKASPFKMVIDSIVRQMKVIDAEEKADDDTKSFCDSEREKNDATHDEKVKNIETLDGEIADITDTIENPETGLKAALAAAQTSIAQCKDNQAQETSSRGAENAEYRANVQNLVAAEETIAKALKVLKDYYAWLERKTGEHHYDEKAGKDSGIATIKRVPEASVEELEKLCSADPNCAGFNTNGVLKSKIADESEWYDNPNGSLYVKVYDSALVQLKATKKANKEDPPETDFKGGQEESGNKAVDMLEFILEETKTEEKTAHENEEKAQAEYEDEMTDLKTEETELLETIAQTEKDLAEQEQALAMKNAEHAAESKEKKAVEDYLLSIKPGCDFMAENIDARKDSRRAEKSALTDSKKLMEGTPEYQADMAAEEASAVSEECKDTCYGDQYEEALRDKDLNDRLLAQAECVACREGTSVAGLCSANPDTPGC